MELNQRISGGIKNFLSGRAAGATPLPVQLVCYNNY